MNDRVMKQLLSGSVQKCLWKSSGKSSLASGQRGFTLFELLVAMLLLAMVSVMIYSVLNVGIRFSEQGNRHILAMERKFGFLSLLQRQIRSAVYDEKKKKIMMSAGDDIFRVVTRNPYLYEYAGVVLAVYRYSSSERAIYYTEKRDYYNIDYGEEYEPAFDEMTLLASDEEGFEVVYDGDAGPEVTFTYQGESYSLVPRCADDEALKKLEFE